MPFTNVLESGSATNRTNGQTYAFSLTLVSGRLYMFGTGGQLTTAATGLWSSITSDGVDAVNTLTTENLTGAVQKWSTTFWILATESATRNITLTVGGSGVTCAQAMWCVDELPAAEFDATDPIYAPNTQSLSGGSQTNPQLNFAAAQRAASIFWGTLAANTTAANVAVNTGSELGESEIESRTQASAQQPSGSGTLIDWNITSTAAVWIGHEINAPGGKAAVLDTRRRRMRPLLVR